ncbi:OLC1v1017794C2 [Oldenlandia corymbosa var. corymbosa]|nr:OLC1v1017794C2 [Oldenlandia corymbosa var. corymbosa]
MPIPQMHSSSFQKMENSVLLSLLQRTTAGNPGRKSKSGGGGGGGGGLFRMFKLLPMLTTGCKMVALLGRPRKHLLTDKATTTVTLFGYRKGRVCIAIQEDPHRLPIFVMELPMMITAFHKEMSSDVLRLAFECDTKTHKKKILEEFVWAVFCNGRRMGFSIRRKNMTEDEAHVMQLLRGVSMGAGVLPSPAGAGAKNNSNNNNNNKTNKEETISGDGELTYIRARFERAVGSKDSESFYMINPDGASAQELSIFFVRVR